MFRFANVWRHQKPTTACPRLPWLVAKGSKEKTALFFSPSGLMFEKSGPGSASNRSREWVETRAMGRLSELRHRTRGTCRDSHSDIAVVEEVSDQHNVNVRRPFSRQVSPKNGWIVTQFTTAFRPVAAIAYGSVSAAITTLAPAPAAAMPTMPEPDPRTSTRRPPQ